MIYNNIEEIYTMMDAVRGKLLVRLAELKDGEADFRPAPDAWTATEIVEHLAILEGNLTKLLTKFTEKAESEGLFAKEVGEIDAPVSFVEIAAKANGIKVVAPEGVRPQGDVSITESLERLNATRAALHALRPRIEKVNLSAMMFPHPLFGPMNAYYWLALIGTHEARHLAQIENTVKGFASAQTA